jgi:hypothetical protein
VIGFTLIVRRRCEYYSINDIFFQYLYYFQQRQGVKILYKYCPIGQKVYSISTFLKKVIRNSGSVWMADAHSRRPSRGIANRNPARRVHDRTGSEKR